MNYKEYQKQYYLINKSRLSKSKAQWYRDNKNRLVEKDREYKRVNKDIINQKRKLYPSYESSGIKHNARRKLRYHIKKGYIKRLPCEVCNSLISQAHHFDYSKPLEVIWLCSKHHGERHRKT